MRKLSTILVLLWLAPLAASAGTISTHPGSSSNPLDLPSQVSLQQTNIIGRVTEAANGLPIGGAQVSVPDLGLSTVTDAAGRFAWNAVSITKRALPTRIIVSASGFGDWSMDGVRLLADDTLILHAELGPTPVSLVIPPPGGQRGAISTPSQEIDLPDTLVAGDSSLPLPEYIRVRVSGYPYHCDTSREYVVETVPFSDYVRHVLPNEWNDEFSESLRAGAIAVKSYAWYWISRGGKWSDADVWDSTCDQVYNPNFEYSSTNAAVNHTWNWRLTKDGELFQTSYRATLAQCGSRENCIGQNEADQMADDGATWDEILHFFYENSLLSEVVSPPAGGYFLRYFGNGHGIHDRVLIAVDDPSTGDPGPPVDVGADDFTIEWRMKAYAAQNAAPGLTCGANDNWLFGNTLLDRAHEAPERKFGVSLAGGRLVVGITGQDLGDGAESLTLCSTAVVADGRWHHIAVQRRRSGGLVWLYVDGTLEALEDGPDGDISYPDDFIPTLATDPFLVVGAGRRDDQPQLYPSFQGWLDELRFSNLLRYPEEFTPPETPLSADEHTLALYKFDEGYGNTLNDTADVPGGPSPGMRVYGGAVNGPEWGISDVFLVQRLYMPLISR